MKSVSNQIIISVIKHMKLNNVFCRTFQLSFLKWLKTASSVVACSFNITCLFLKQCSHDKSFLYGNSTLYITWHFVSDRPSIYMSLLKGNILFPRKQRTRLFKMYTTSHKIRTKAPTFIVKTRDGTLPTMS